TMALERALAPLMIIGGFCNLAMFEYPLGQPRPYISCLYGLAKWSLLMYFWYYPEISTHLQRVKTIYITDIISVLTIILILISICRFKELKMCLRELTIVDHTLEALGMPKESQRLRNWIIRMIIGWIVYVFYQLAWTNFIVFFDVIEFLPNDEIFIGIFYFTLITFLKFYSSNIIIVSAMISAAIIGLVLYMCIHLLCKLFFLTLCVKLVTV
ncbi:hypothetical protein ALC57_14701, partial [Trachymyrmex cornetzi]